MEALEDRRMLSGLKAFYGAEGFGSEATGGRGGEVYIVTNLNASGPGSFREGVEGPRSGPRTIVFAVGGEINLNGARIRARNAGYGDLTIAGQTAPGGIVLRNGYFETNNVSNVIVRHLTVRWGDTSQERDAFFVTDTQNAIFDHISASWGTDENFSITRNVTNITLQNSLIAEGLRSGHQYGSLINSEYAGGGRITLYGNLYTNLLGRMPRAASQNGQPFLLEMVNNVLYNWGTGGDWGAQPTATSNEYASWNLVNNYHIAGPNSFQIFGNQHRMLLHAGSGGDDLYMSGNYIDSDRDGVLDGTLANTSNLTGSYNLFNQPFAVPEWAQISNLMSAQDALTYVLANVGAQPWNRDGVDARLVSEVQSWGTQGSIKTSRPPWPTINGGTAPTDTDKDGMPDYWETWYGTNPLVANNNAVHNDIGYTDLEQYLQWLIDPDSIDPIAVPPTASAGGPYLLQEGSALVLAGSGTDPSGTLGPLTYSWDLNGDGVFGDATGAAPTVSWSQLAALGIQDGPATFNNVRLRVTNSVGTATTSSSTLLTVENVPPTVDAGGPYAIDEGAALLLGGFASDVAADPLTYTWDLNDDGVFDDALGPNPTLSWAELQALGIVDNGTFTISLRVSDGDGGETTATTSLTIANTAPVVDVGGPYTIVEGAWLTLAGSAIDAGGAADPLSYSWDLNGDLVFDDAVGPAPVVTWTQLVALGIVDGPATFAVRLRVSDDDGGVTTSEPVELVLENAPPMAGMTGTSVSTPGLVHTYSLWALDPTTVDQAFDFTFEIDWNGDGTPDQTLAGASGTQVTRSFDTPGTHRVRVRATDKDGGRGEWFTYPVHIWRVRQVGADVEWDGSDGDDRVSFHELAPGQIEVRTQVVGGTTINVVQTFSGVTGRVIGRGHGGRDLLDAGALATLPVTLEGGRHSDTLIGGAADDLLRGEFPGAAGDGAEGNDSILGGPGNDRIEGDGAEGGEDTLRGGPGDDTILGDASDGAEGRGDSIFGDEGDDQLFGHHGNDRIDGGDGHDLITGGDGSEGNDTLLGGAGDDILSGGSGKDSLVGGDGRDLLIGGVGLDTLAGNGGEDLLIADRTSFDLNAAALMAIHAEWLSAHSYAERIEHLTGTPGGANGSTFLTPGVTLFDDEVVDDLTGGTELDWYLYSLLQDVLHDEEPEEETLDLSGFVMP
ncbi:MAG: hypothetical protein KF708_21610 [Pirellulales bacterium]|nr:hypothetical protein [Pirellulales bacterium]